MDGVAGLMVVAGLMGCGLRIPVMG